MGFIKLNWRKWQFAISGIAFGIGTGDDRKELEKNIEKPIDTTLTPLGLLALIIAVISIISEFAIRFGAALLLRQKFDDGGSIIVDFADYGGHFDDWMNESGTQKCSPTFEEEYIHYKYYRAMSKWAYKKSFRDYLPPELDKVADDAKKNYLTSRLSGIKERLD